MTGMIHSGRQSDACPGCGQITSEQEWTCPCCGRILDRYLFGTITAKSLTGPDKDAFGAGYEACMNRWKETGLLELGDYHPVPGHETGIWRRMAACCGQSGRSGGAKTRSASRAEIASLRGGAHAFWRAALCERMEQS